jgi:(2R)-3-sulfolactate dehydrogenase (NADP+)
VPQLTLEDLRRCAVRALLAAGANRAAARAVADALVAAEADGVGSHGVSRLPDYVAQLGSGKVDGRAVPVVSRPAPGVIRVDARGGFAFPAVERGLDAAFAVVKEHGTAAVAVTSSHHLGAAGLSVERIARAGFVGIALGNTPAAIAPWGGRRPVFGTNVVAFAFPRSGHPPLVIDLALSVAARGRLAMAANRGERIPEGWAFDEEGMPTTDPVRGLRGSLRPIGDHKGALLAMAVEIIAGALSGSRFGYEASSFYTPDGGRPGVGQIFLLLDPGAFGGCDFRARVEDLLAHVLDDPGARLPGARRLDNRAQAQRSGVFVPDELWGRLQRLAAWPRRRLPPPGE